ncbi:uncharacterized protein [Drosophila kikkawai]|uniref:DUF4780 domain-containing protein n=1 Tax=Drosophila kikkawai TaxID=30033 RepID=A0ABM4GFU8_DROKI
MTNCITQLSDSLESNSLNRSLILLSRGRAEGIPSLNTIKKNYIKKDDNKKNYIKKDDNKKEEFNKAIKGSAKTSTPQASQPKHSKAAASQAKATGEHGKTKPWTHQQRKAQASKAHFILAKIARNEKEGKADPQDLADKARYLAVIEEYERYEKEHPETLLLPQTKRNRSQEVSESAPKRAKDAKGAPRPTTYVKTAKKFSEVARDTLAMALVDELNDDGRLLMETWEKVETQLAEMVTDKLLSEPTGQSPSFDSSDMVRGHRVIRCDDEFSRDFLADCVARLGKA